MEKIELKRTLIAKCIEILESEIRETKKAMDDAQEEANSHKGAMESRYDTFKEEAQYKVGAYARKLVLLSKQLSQIQLIKIGITTQAQLGSIVESEEKKYFLVGYLGPEPIQVGEEKYFPISISSPIGKMLLNKKAGETVHFNGKIIKIINVF